LFISEKNGLKITQLALTNGDHREIKREKEIDAIAPIKSIIDIGNSTAVASSVGFWCATFQEEEKTQMMIISR
jgi:hypothetical protein